MIAVFSQDRGERDVIQTERSKRDAESGEARGGVHLPHVKCYAERRSERIMEAAGCATDQVS
jgi:hypothetical protein